MAEPKRRTPTSWKPRFTTALRLVARDVHTDLLHLHAEEVEFLYSYPKRFYHTTSHVVQMLSELDRYIGACGEPAGDDLTILILSIVYHDCVYDTMSSENEHRSALFAAKRLTSLQVAPALARRVKTLIESTDHERQVKDRNMELLLDLDLSVFGSSSSEYGRYSTGIRQEYRWVDEEQFREARKKILTEFLGRRRIFQTTFFFDRLEGRARRNLEAELQVLWSGRPK